MLDSAVLWLDQLSSQVFWTCAMALLAIDLVAVNLYPFHEAVAAGAARLVGASYERIVAETQRLLDDADAYAAMAGTVNPYGDGCAAVRIADHLANTVT